MPLYFSAKKVPELAGLTTHEQAVLWKKAMQEANLALRLKVMPFFAIPVVVFVLGILFLEHNLPARLALVAGAFGVSYALANPVLSAHARASLREQGYPKPL
jgi:hypothetical protein